jgi:hypothetical protein
MTDGSFGDSEALIQKAKEENQTVRIAVVYATIPQIIDIRRAIGFIIGETNNLKIAQAMKDFAFKKYPGREVAVIEIYKPIIKTICNVTFIDHIALGELVYKEIDGKAIL